MIIPFDPFPVYSFTPVDKDSNPERFIFKKLTVNEIRQWNDKQNLFMVFLLKGHGRIKLKEGSEIPLSEKDFLLIRQAEFQAYTPCELAIWFPDGKFDPEDRSFLRILQPQVIVHPYVSLSLKIKPAIENFFELLFAYKQDGLIEQDTLFEIKQRELFLLLRYYYDPEELSALFYPLLCRLNGFREQILEHFHQVKNTGELIQKLGMKRTSFERKFRQHFGTSAHQWLLQQKAVAVLRSLQEGKYSLNEIRSMYGFNSATHFVRFCRRQLGAPPSQLRQALWK